MERALPLPPSLGRGSRGFDALFIGVVCLFVAAIYVETSDLPATARDQVADLGLALRMREGGLLTDGNRHPLLPALLAPFAERDPGFFVAARVVSLLATAAALALAYLGAALVYSRPLALLAIVAALFEWRLQARRVCPEPLVAGLLVLATAWLALAGRARRPLLAAAGGGAALGLAWLAKGTALLSLLAALAFLPIARGRRGLSQAGVALAAFLLAASPLLAWNVGRHRDPFFNANTSHVQWEASWDADLDRTSDATPATWYAEHGLDGTLSRLGRGLVHQKGLEWPYGFLALVALAALWVRRPGRGATDEPPEDPARRDWRRLAAVSCLAWVPPIAWYEPIVASRRFLFPLVPVLAPPALDLLRRFVPDLARRATSVVARVGVAAGAVLAAAAVALVALRGSADPARHFAPGALDAARLLAARPGDRSPERVLARPSRTAPPEWMVDGSASLGSLPGSVGPIEAPAWIRARFDAVLLTSGLLAQRPGALAFLARWDDERGVVLADPLPAGFARAGSDPGTPSRYALVSVSPR